MFLIPSQANDQSFVNTPLINSISPRNVVIIPFMWSIEPPTTLPIKLSIELATLVTIGLNMSTIHDIIGAINLLYIIRPQSIISATNDNTFARNGCICSSHTSLMVSMNLSHTGFILFSHTSLNIFAVLFIASFIPSNIACP